MKRSLKLAPHFFIVVGILTLTACASMTAPPRCPDSNGLSCARVDQINTMIDRGQFGEPVAGRFSQKDEKNNRIWIAPYTDESGNDHKARFITSALKPSHSMNKMKKPEKQ